MPMAGYDTKENITHYPFIMSDGQESAVLPGFEHIKSAILRLPDTYPCAPAQHESLACRHEHIEKRSMDCLRISKIPYI